MKYHFLDLVVSNCDESVERFLLKVKDMLNNIPHRFIPQYMSTVSPFLIKQHTMKAYKFRGDLTPNVTKLITSRTLRSHFHIQAVLHTRNVLCVPSDRRRKASHVG